MVNRNIAFLLAFAATLIYGVSYTVAKDVMPAYIKPYGFILARVAGAALLFWISGLFIRKEKIDPQDYIRIVLASFFGVALNMLAFFKGLSLTTPISASVIMVTTPILVLSFSVFFLKEEVTKRKLAGIFIGMAGAVLLIVYGQKAVRGSGSILGDSLVLLNASSYALYLILVKNLTKKYHPLTFAKWLYSIGLIFVLPFAWSEFKEVDWMALPVTAGLKIGFIVVFTTFFTYMLNLFAIGKLKPTTLSIFIYLQPLIASGYALLMGSDTLNAVKLGAAALIFTGVYLVTRKPQQE